MLQRMQANRPESAIQSAQAAAHEEAMVNPQDEQVEALEDANRQKQNIEENL